MSGPETFSRDADRDLLAAAIREGGALALSFLKHGVKSWNKKPGEIVSDADLAVDARLKQLLMAERPDYGWLSEETADDPARLEKPRVWIVDPIDGTRAFVQRRPEFTVCGALVEDGQPILACVFNPATDEFFEARAGQGATLNGKAISVSDKADLAGARLLASQRTFKAHDWGRLAPGARFGQRNSIAYRLSLVACGEFDAAVSLRQKSDWDLAAADLILREAGGLMTDSRGQGFTYNGECPQHRNVIAANPALHARLLEMLAGE